MPFMRALPGLISLVVVVWLVIGAIAAYQRDYFTSEPSCASFGTIAMTTLAGPLNFGGVNPQVESCRVPDVNVPEVSR